MKSFQFIGLNSMRLCLWCLCFLSFSIGLKSQVLRINNASNPESFLDLADLTEEVLINTSGCSEVTNFNVRTNGGGPTNNTNKSYGYFERPSGNNFPFESGVAISSGRVFQGGNTINNTPLDNVFNGIGDPDLENALGVNNTFDATFVEFDFVPQVDQISFRYIMASEEYEGNSGADAWECFFSDGFAFLLEDLTTGTTTNLAVLPDGQPVNIGTVNNEPQCLSNPQLYVRTENFETNYSGRTVPLTASATVIPDRTYRIKLVVADQSDASFDTTIFLEAGSFNFGVEITDQNGDPLPDTVDLCEGENFTMDAKLTQSNVTFEWSKDGTVLSGETGSSLNLNNLQASDSGVYKVNVVTGSCTTGFSDEITISVQELPDLSSIGDLESCLIENSNEAIFDLTQNSIAGFNNRFYLSQTDAQNGDPSNALDNPENYSVSASTTIWQRVENAALSSCFEIINFQAIVLPLPESNDLDLSSCSTNGTTANFDLTQILNEIRNGNTNNSVSFFENQTDAINNSNPINTPENYTSNAGEIYARVTDSNACFSIATINLMVNFSPTLTPIQEELCDEDRDGLVVVNLNNYLPQLIGNQTDTSTTFYTSQTDANNGINPITNPENFSTDGSTIFARSHFNPTPDCFNITTINFSLITRPQATQAPQNILHCDTDGNGSEEIDLTTIADQVIGNQSGLSVTFHTSNSDAQNNTNGINTNNPFVANLGTSTIFVRLASLADCFEVYSFEIEVSNSPTAQNVDLEFCDTDGDGTMTINLNDSTPEILNGQTGLTVTFHNTLSGAQNNTDTIPDPGNFTTNSTTVYARVTDNSGLCHADAQINISIFNLPPTPSEIDETFCDENNDGSEPIDLTLFNNVLLSGQSGLNLSYHNSLNDAQTNQNAITNPENYTLNLGNTTLYARIESNINCFITHQINLALNEIPVGQTINRIEECEDPENGNTFTLNQFDTQIYSGTLQVTITYHTSQSDADNNLSPINQFSAPVGASSIFARIDSGSCYSTIAIEFLIHPIPELMNSKIALETCDADGDGLSFYDLTEAESLLINNPEEFTFQYFLSLTDAENNENEIATGYQSTAIGTIIYARVENPNTQCFSIAEIELGTNSTYLQADPLPTCDDNNDGFAAFDLEPMIDEVQTLLDNNLGVTFHLSSIEAEQGINPLSNINSFENTTANTQTIFARSSETGQCQGIVQFDLVVNPLPEINVNQEEFFCPNTSIDVTATGNFDSVRWIFNGQVIGNSPTLTATESGEYIVEGIFDNTGCSQTKTVQVKYHPTPEIVDVIVNGRTAQIIAQGDAPPFEYSLDGTNFQMPGNNFFDNLPVGQSSAFVRNAFGCLNQTPFNFVVINFSNFISPNGDGINDELVFEGIEFLEGSTIQIYDRYGKMILNHVVKNEKFSWNADYLTRSLPTSTYWYIINLTDGRKLTGYFVVKND